MTLLQLRIKYHIETGKYPTHGEDIDGCRTFRGGLINSYAEWIEDYLLFEYSIKSPIDLRQRFKSETGIKAIYSNYHYVVYSKPYKYWMEELLCEQLK